MLFCCKVFHRNTELDVQHLLFVPCAVAFNCVSRLRVSFSCKLVFWCSGLWLKFRTSVVDGQQLIHYYTVALSLASSVVSSARWPSADYKSQHLKTQILQYDKAEIALVLSEQQKSFFCDWPNAARHSGSVFPLNITLDNRSCGFYRTGNICFLPHLVSVWP